MSEKKESWVTDNDGKIVGKDTTNYSDDGSSRTVHQDVVPGGVILGPSPSKITGVTYNSPDGTSTHVKK